jgi:hypothetical protein
LKAPEERSESREDASIEAKLSPSTDSLAATAVLTALPATWRAHSTAIFGRTVLSELRLILKGTRWWWYVVAGGLILAALLSPVDRTRNIWLPLAWIWPLLAWAPLGSRAARHRMEQLVLSAPYPVRNRIFAAWLAGVVVALATASGAVVRLAVGGHWAPLVALGVGSAFVPALALACGVWTRGRKLFEVVYLVIWYIGPMSGTVGLDYLGASDAAIDSSIPLVYALVTVGLVVLALLGSRRERCS